MTVIIAKAPVRYSVRQPDFDRELGSRLLIFVDGVRVERVIAYDCEAGTVERYATDEAGSIRIDRAKGEAVTEVLRGIVTAEIAD